MSQKVKVFIVGFIVLIAMGVAALLFAINLFKANDTVMSLEDYYKEQIGTDVTDDKAVLILQNEIQKDLLDYKNGEIYLDYDMVVNLFNERFYWDANEKLMLYTLPDKTIEIKPDETSYSNGEENVECENPIVYQDGDKVKVALSFVEQYSNIKSTFYENPNRVVLRYVWGEDELVAKVNNDTQLRNDGSSDGEILKELKSGDKLTYIMEDNTDVSKGYVRAITEDGILGYVKENDMQSSSYENVESDFEEVVYSNISKDYAINLTWNMVSNETANGFVSDLLDSAPGVNTISPTWFSIADENGGISSLASHDYVDEVHSRNIEVWGLVDDFTPDVSIKEILTHTSSRRNLVKNLIDAAKEYDLDGINVDFEYIKEGFAADYTQFLRELSVECRKEQIVLSVDSYVPMYSQFYNRTEQGKVVDYVIIMGYDEHNSSSAESGSVASISWTQSAIDQTKEQVSDSKKIIIGIPFYDRLWEEENNQDGTTTIVSCTDMTMSASNDWISENDAQMKWDDETKQNYAECSQGTHTFKMWLEDAKSIEEKMKVISDAKIGGVGSWRLGQETSDVWPVIDSYINN